MLWKLSIEKITSSSNYIINIPYGHTYHIHKINKKIYNFKIFRMKPVKRNKVLMKKRITALK